MAIGKLARRSAEKWSGPTRPEMNPYDRGLLRRVENEISRLRAANYRSTKPLALEMVVRMEHANAVFMQIGYKLDSACRQSPLARVTGRIPVERPKGIDKSTERKRRPCGHAQSR